MTYSSDREDSEVITNPNTEYTQSIWFPISYLTLLGTFVSLCSFFAFPQDITWTIINIVHAIVCIQFLEKSFV